MVNLAPVAHHDLNIPVATYAASVPKFNGQPPTAVGKIKECRGDPMRRLCPTCAFWEWTDSSSWRAQRNIPVTVRRFLSGDIAIKKKTIEDMSEGIFCFPNRPCPDDFASAL
jgi:hypothetical protein